MNYICIFIHKKFPKNPFEFCQDQKTPLKTPKKCSISHLLNVLKTYFSK